MFHYLYILQSQKDGKFYTGITSDLRQRLKEHNLGENTSTLYRRPFKLVYYEAYLLKTDAEAREKYLKTSMGKRVIKKQLANFFNTKANRFQSPQPRTRLRLSRRYFCGKKEYKYFGYTQY